MDTMTLYRLRIHFDKRPHTIAFFMTRLYAEEFVKDFPENWKPSVDEIEISIEDLAKIY